MNIRHLRIFQAVCKEGSMTKAAEKLFMTQPAISHVIGELEEELGVPLFDRLSRKLAINEMGKLFLEKTVRMLELYDGLKETGQNLNTQAPIRIGSSITIGNFALPGIMSAFENQCPDTPAYLTIDNAKSIMLLLMNNEIDIALIEGTFPQEPYDKIPFSVSSLTVVCSSSHPFASRPSITIGELKQERLLLREKGSAIRDTFDSTLLLHNCPIVPAWTSVNSQALLQAVKHGLGISVLPSLLAEPELKKGTIAAVTIDKVSLSCTNHIVYHKDKFLSEPLKAFLSIVLGKQA